MWTNITNKLALYTDSLNLLNWGMKVLSSDDKKGLLIKKKETLEIPFNLIFPDGQKTTSIEIEFYTIPTTVSEKFSSYGNIFNFKKEYYDVERMIASMFEVIRTTLMLSHFQKDKFFEKKASNSISYGDMKESYYELSLQLKNGYNNLNSFLKTKRIEEQIDKITQQDFDHNQLFMSYLDVFGKEGIEKHIKKGDVFFDVANVGYEMYIKKQNYFTEILASGLETLDFVNARIKEIDSECSDLIDKEILPIKRFKHISEKELWNRRNKTAKYIL